MFFNSDPPTSLNITVQPHGPYRAQTNVTFTCHIHGGKPKPSIYFYRINAPLDNGNISLIRSNSFTSKHILENITQTTESTELKWQLTEADNTASFGCAATSPIIKDQMFSLFIKVKIICEYYIYIYIYTFLCSRCKKILNFYNEFSFQKAHLSIRYILSVAEVIKIS